MVRIAILLALVSLFGCDKAQEVAEAASASAKGAGETALTRVELKVGQPVGIPIQEPKLESIIEIDGAVCGSEVFSNGAFALRTAGECTDVHEIPWTLFSGDGRKLATYDRLISQSPEHHYIFVAQANDQRGGMRALINLETGETWAPEKPDDRYGFDIHFVQDSDKILVSQRSRTADKDKPVGLSILDSIPTKLPEPQAFAAGGVTGNVRWDASRDAYVFYSRACLEAMFSHDRGEAKCILEIPSELMDGRDTLMTPDWFLIEPRDGDPAIAFQRKTGKQLTPSAGDCDREIVKLPPMNATAPAMLLACGEHFGAMKQMQIWTPKGQFPLPEGFVGFIMTYGNIYELRERSLTGVTNHWLDVEHLALVDAAGHFLVGDRVASNVRPGASTHQLSRYHPDSHTVRPLGKMECRGEILIEWHTENLMTASCFNLQKHAETITWDFESKKAYRSGNHLAGFSNEYLYYLPVVEGCEGCPKRQMARVSR